MPPTDEIANLKETLFQNLFSAFNTGSVGHRLGRHAPLPSNRRYSKLLKKQSSRKRSRTTKEVRRKAPRNGVKEAWQIKRIELKKWRTQRTWSPTKAVLWISITLIRIRLHHPDTDPDPDRDPSFQINTVLKPLKKC